MTGEKTHIDYNTLATFAEGSPDAFAAIYQRYYLDLYFLAKKLVEESAPDVLADVFTEVWNQKKSFDDADHLFYYMRSMTRNACFDHLKKEQRNLSQTLEFGQLSDKEYRDSYFREITESNLFAQIRAEIEKLPPHLKEVFRLSYIQGFKNAEIAEKLGIKDASVRVRKAEALKILRAALQHTELPLLLMLALLDK